MALEKGDLILTISKSIRDILPRLYNKEVVFLSRQEVEDSFGSKKFGYFETRTLLGLCVSRGSAGESGGFTAQIIGNKEWTEAAFIVYCITTELPKLRDKVRIEGVGELSITNIQSFEDILILGINEEQ